MTNISYVQETGGLSYGGTDQCSWLQGFQGRVERQNPRLTWEQRKRYWWLWRVKSCKHKTLFLKLGGGSGTCHSPKMNLNEMLQTNRSSCSQNLQCGCTTAVLQRRFGPKFPIRFMGEMPFSHWCKSPADRRFPLIKYSCSLFQRWEFTCSGWKREVCENAEKVLI